VTSSCRYQLPAAGFRLPASGFRLTAQRDEMDFAVRNLPQRFDHEFLLSCSDSRLQIVEGIAPKHWHPALTHDGAGVVLSVYQMNRTARSRLTRLQHCLEDSIPIHARPAESR